MAQTYYGRTLSPIGASMRTCLLIVSFVLVSCSAAEPIDEQKMIELKLVINQEAIDGGVVLLESTLTNDANEFKFLPWNTPFDEAVNGRFLRVTKITGDGSENELAYRGRMIKRRAPIEKDYIVVSVGKTLKNQLDITKSYNFCRNRHYNINLYGDLFDADLQALTIKVVSAQFKANEKFSPCGT